MPNLFAFIVILIKTNLDKSYFVSKIWKYY
jgi:hypothetical protein